MKICTLCKKQKEDEEFHLRNPGSTRRNSYCKPCQKEYKKEHYRTNKEQYIKRVRKDKRARKEVISTLKESLPCTDCKRNYPSWIMDFDHRDGSSKKKNVSQIVDHSLKQALEEIAKCDLVCSNCHRQRTHDRLINRPSSSNG